MAKYDVAIIGAGLGGLATAALLAGRRKKTVVIERGASYSGAVGFQERDNFRFSCAPPLSYGFERGLPVYEMSVGLGILHHAAVTSPCYQVALPDRRITVYADVSETLEELRREFPREIDSLAQFYKDLHKVAERSARNRFFSFLSKHRTAAGFMRGYRFSRELTTFFDVQLDYFFQRPSAETSLASLISLCDSPPLYFYGGFKKVADQLYSVILQQSGEVHYGEPSPRITVHNGRAIEIETTQGVLEADTVLLDTVSAQPTSTYFFAVRDEVVPVGMSQEVLYLPAYEQPRDFVSLSLSASDDASASPEGMRALRATFRTGPNAVVDQQERVRRISRLVPFLNDHLIFAEQYRDITEGAVVPANMPFKMIWSAGGMPLLSRGSCRNLYELKDMHHAPSWVLSAVHRFTKQLK